MVRSAVIVVALVLVACIDRHTAARAVAAVQADRAPDVMPSMQNRDLPFHYPPALFARHVQGNVTIRIHIDSAGVVWPESTSVAESSGYPALDSAAVEGARHLRFTPAQRAGHPVGISLLLPVYFRYPNAPPLPGDSILRHARRTSPAPAKP